MDTTSGNASDPENSADDFELTDGEHPTSKDHELATDLHKKRTQPTTKRTNVPIVSIGSPVETITRCRAEALHT
ncbi:transcription termination protein NusB [Cutibacterium acnes JCM 18909]|nr:transcription termination protein NusB [Cutibacterium acnes JCM 18909]